jgi:hypothetical protein
MMKLEIKYLRRPKVHYCLCLSKYNFRSRKLSKVKLYMSLFFSYEFWFYVVVFFDIVFMLLWAFIYVYYFSQILFKVESTEEVEMIRKSEDFINYFFGFIKVDGSVIIIQEEGSGRSFWENEVRLRINLEYISNLLILSIPTSSTLLYKLYIGCICITSELRDVQKLNTAMYLTVAYSCTSFLIYAEEVMAVYPWIELRWNHIGSYLFFQFCSSFIQVLVTI